MAGNFSARHHEDVTTGGETSLGGDVPLERFLTGVKPAFGDRSWWAEVAAMLADPDELELVWHLGTVLRAGRAFGEPVVVCDGRVSNGMHRVVASILAGAATIPVVTEAQRPLGPWVEVSFIVVGPVGANADVFDAVCGALRSFPMPGGWVETETLGGAGELLTGVWECPADLTASLPAELMRRAARRGLTLTVRSVRTLVDLDELWVEEGAPG